MSPHLAVLLLLVLAVLAKDATGAGHGHRHKFSVKTIKSEDGDTIDCVDIYKQPSLEHLSLENRALQVFQSHRPSPFRSSLNASRKVQQVHQVWQKSGRCPQGTIPIRRATWLGDRKLDYSSLMSSDGDIERAIAFTPIDSPFHGGKADLSVWALQVQPNEYSMNYVTVMTANNQYVRSFEDLNITDFVRAGWMVHPGLYGDDQPRLFVQWSNDNGVKTGCFNLDCKGFVQVSSDYAMGNRIVPLSVYNDPAKQYCLPVNIYLDASQRRWYVEFNNQVAGYWPVDELFPEFYNAPFVTWGGQILNTWPDGRHTPTQMGNGHRADEGPERAGMAFSLAVLDAEDVTYGYSPGFYEDRGGCYDTKGFVKNLDYGHYFTYGGLGLNYCT